MLNPYRGRLLASTLLAGAAAIAAPAYAQDPATSGAPAGIQSQESAGPAEPASSGEIVVTGTLVRNPNLVASSPVTAVGQEELQLRQTNTAEQILREIPGAVASQGSQVNNGQSSSGATVNLRGLGPQRNLVLLDGQRITPANFNGTVDLNNIPLALVERVDVLTGGASTSYGADAVSGVVNFITRSDFAGVEAQVSNQLTEDGDGNYVRADVTVGANFDDGRGNAVFSIGYQQADAIYQGERGYARNVISSTSGFAGGGSPTAVPTTVAFNRATLQSNPTGTGFQAPYSDFNFAPFNIFQTPFERFNMYGAGHYEINDTVEIYARGVFSKNSVKQIIAPSGIFGEALTINSNNPYLNPGLLAGICAQQATPVTGAACTAAAGTTLQLPAVYRRSVEVGPRISDFTTTIFDYKAGIRVNLTETTQLDVSGAYGESENIETRSGYVLRSRVQQALNATNTATCTNTANGCVPLNLFGPLGSITPEQANFLNGSSTVSNRSSLAQGKALLSGDFGTSSPWASDPIGFAVGAEYREYQAVRQPDNLALVPGELGGAGGAVLPLNGGYNVYEAFGELIAPIVQDAPFFHSLTAEGGIRYSRYKVNAPGNPTFKTTTWKAGGSWEPIEALKIRGNYQRAVRAPNIGELFAPISTALTNLGTDPCASLDVNNIRRSAGPTGNLAAVCLAQGAPASGLNNIQDPAAGQANGTGGGNPALRPEKADSYTIGLVFQPREWVPGLSFTVDYYNIEINDAIASAQPGDVIAACFGNLTAASATSAACTSIRRNPVNGRLSGSSVTTPGLPTPLTNAGRIKTDGVDFGANYRTDALGFAQLNLSFQGNYTRRSKFQAGATSANRECAGFYSVNCAPTFGAFAGGLQPEWAWNQRTTLTFGAVDFSVLWRHIDKVRYEPGLPPLFSGAITGNTDLRGETINFNRIPSYDYFDATVRFSLTDNFELTLTAMNVFNKRPPIVGANAGNTSFNSGNTFPSTYDPLGRRFAAQARLKF